MVLNAHRAGFNHGSIWELADIEVADSLIVSKGCHRISESADLRGSVRMIRRSLPVSRQLRCSSSIIRISGGYTAFSTSG